MDGVVLVGVVGGVHRRDAVALGAERLVRVAGRGDGGEVGGGEVDVAQRGRDALQQRPVLDEARRIAGAAQLVRVVDAGAAHARLAARLQPCKLAAALRGGIGVDEVLPGNAQAVAGGLERWAGEVRPLGLGLIICFVCTTSMPTATAARRRSRHGPWNRSGTKQDNPPRVLRLSSG